MEKTTPGVLFEHAFFFFVCGGGAWGRRGGGGQTDLALFDSMGVIERAFASFVTYSLE